jgi:hypothetical protein
MPRPHKNRYGGGRGNALRWEATLPRQASLPHLAPGAPASPSSLHTPPAAPAAGAIRRHDGPPSLAHSRGSWARALEIACCPRALALAEEALSAAMFAHGGAQARASQGALWGDILTAACGHSSVKIDPSSFRRAVSVFCCSRSQNRKYHRRRGQVSPHRKRVPLVTSLPEGLDELLPSGPQGLGTSVSRHPFPAPPLRWPPRLLGAHFSGRPNVLETRHRYRPLVASPVD